MNCATVPIWPPPSHSPASHTSPWPQQPSRAWGCSSTLLSLALMQTWLWLYSLLKVCVSKRKHCRERRRTVGHEAHPTSHSSWAFSSHNPQPPCGSHFLASSLQAELAAGCYLHSQLLLPLAGGLRGRGAAFRCPISREWGGDAGGASGLRILAGAGGQGLHAQALGCLQLLTQ